MRTKKTPQIKRIVAAISQLQKLSLVEIKKKLRKKGYRCVNRGGFKMVFRRKKDPVCVKVYDECNGWQSDSYHVPKGFEPYILYPVFKCKKFLIQEWVEKVIECESQRPKKESDRLPDDIWGSKDVREDNVGIKDGKEVIIDFVT